MLKNRKIQLQSKTIRRLQDTYARLTAENKELKKKLQDQLVLAQAAEKYRAEHQKAMAALNSAKERYNEAVRSVISEKKQYREEFQEFLKEI